MTDKQKTEIEQILGEFHTVKYIEFLQAHRVPHTYILMMAFGHGVSSEKDSQLLKLERELTQWQV